ncbi:MAG: hypothetical protein ACOC4Y_02610, partial [bacterium]
MSGLNPRPPYGTVPSNMKNPFINLWHFIADYRYYFIILAVYFIGFLLITPLGRFNPGVPHAPSYSLMTIDPWDDTAYYMIGKSAIVDGDLDYSNEKLPQRAYWSLNELGNPHQGARIPIGPSILWAPFIFLAHILTLLFNFFGGGGLSTDGYAPQYLLTTCVGSSIYAFLSLLISYKILTKFFSPSVSLLSVLTVFWGNTLVYNTYVRMLMSHAPEAFTIALFVFLFTNIVARRQATDYFLFGISGGLLVIVRYDNFVFLILPLLDVFFLFLKSMKSRQWDFLGEAVKKYILSAVISFLVVLPQFLHFYIQTGMIIPKSLGGQLASTFDSIIHLKDLFLGETRNILWGKPIVFIGLLGSCLFIKQNRLLGIGFTIIIIFGITWLFWRPHVYWWGMDFGIRHLIKLSVPLAFGYAALIKSVNIRGKVAVFSTVSCVIVLWEYVKIIQVPSITPILKEGFLSACVLKIPDLLINNPISVLTGTECSYLKVLTTYGLKLNQFNRLDYFFLIILPLSILVLCLFLVTMVIYGDKGHFTRRSAVKCGIGVVSFFFALSITGLAYPKKPASKIYRDFKRAAVLAYDAGHYGLSLRYLDKALSIITEGDALIRKLIGFMKEDYYDFGTAGARGALKKGWSIDEGHISGPEAITFVWAVGREASIEVDANTTGSYKTLVFRARPYPADQCVTIILNNKHIGHIKADPGWREYRMRVDAGQLQPAK